MLLPFIEDYRAKLDFSTINEERRKIVQALVDYVQLKKDQKETINLNFVCTHNSRRSQFSQLWAKTAAFYYGIEMNSYSGGVEVTAFNERAVASIKRTGFKVGIEEGDNPIYKVYFAEEKQPLEMFSKVVEDEKNKVASFAAVMTCAHADENCPFIPNADARIPLRYEDPKAFDDTSKEAEMYDLRSLQIATELFYAFSKVK